MSRISMKEMYDNRDVVTQIYELKDELDTANESASDANTKATNALTTANEAVARIDETLSGVETALVNSATALENSKTALSKATTAQTTADKGVADAATAQATADTAEDKADNAQTTADKGIALVEIQASASAGTLYTKTTKNVEVTQNIPLASQTQAGLMNAQTYQTLNELNSRVSILENKQGTVYVTFTSDNPTQTEITGLFVEKVGRAPQSGDTVKDISRGLAYEYDGTTWVKYASPISGWSNEGAGIVKGTPATGEAGTLFAETDGTGSVNGWDELNATVTNNNIAINAKADACYNAYGLTASEDVVSFSMTTVAGTVVGQGIPQASATQAGTIKASEYTEFKGKQNGINTVAVTLSAGGWTDGAQTVAVEGMTADALVWVAPASDSFSAYASAVCRATAQDTDSLTFAVDTIPEASLTVNVGWSV